jgi:hypothetical protein
VFSLFDHEKAPALNCPRFWAIRSSTVSSTVVDSRQAAAAVQPGDAGLVSQNREGLEHKKSSSVFTRDWLDQFCPPFVE